MTGLKALACALAAAGLFYLFARPSIHPVAIVQDGEITHVSSWSETVIRTENTDQDILFHVESLLPIGVLQFYIDDCLQSLTVNGQAVESSRLPYCNWFDFLQLDVSPYMHAGSNAITATLHNDLGTGNLRVTVASSSWLYRLTLALMLVSISLIAWYWGKHQKRPETKILITLLAVGTLLRIFYAAHTDFDTRAYDWDGHLEYMRFIADHWVLPKGDAGWEFHQQPLYYILGGAVLSFLRFIRMEGAFISIMQSLSLLMSLATLYVSGWIATMIFPVRTAFASVQRFVFLGFLATVPAFVMFSSRINNDVPTLLFATLCIAFLFHWQKNGTFESWALMSSSLVLALLSKSSALPLLALVGCGFLFRRDSIMIRLRNVLFLGVLLLIVVGGTLLIRVIIQGQQELVPVWVSSGLHVKNFAAAFYTFHPLEILRHPFNHNWVDSERRQYLWEYCFKSVFFGEWEFRSFFHWQAITILVSGMLLVPVILWGIVRSTWKHARIDIQLLVLLVVSFLALACFRYLHPNSSNQEIRYISFVLIPIAYFLARGIALIPRGRALLILPGIIFVLSIWFEIVVAVGSR